MGGGEEEEEGGGSEELLIDGKGEKQIPAASAETKKCS